MVRLKGTASQEYQPCPWQVFAGELADFLKEEGMSSESFTEYDIAASQLFVKSGGRLRASFAMIASDLQAELQKEGLSPGFSRVRNKSQEPFVFVSDGGVIWDWAYLFPPLSREKYNNWSVSWGLRFPELSTWWRTCDPPLPKGTHVFVVWGAERKPPVPVMKPADLPNGWIPVPDGGAIAARSLSEFDHETGSLAAEISKWISERAREILLVSKTSVQNA